jgi:predicted naringenin-chalcone synthase
MTGDNVVKVRIKGMGTALPSQTIKLNELKEQFTEIYGEDPRFLKRLLRIVDNTGVRCRYLCRTPEYLITPRPLGETSEVFLQEAIPLAEAAAREALEEAGVSAHEVDLVVATSCTGIPIPGVDADLVNLLGLRQDVIRLPIAQMGCAGGAIGLARASQLLRGIGGGVALVVAVELPSLTFQRHDLSMANMISTCIFGDGAAAAVLTTRAETGLTLVAQASHHFPDSRGLMGFLLEEGGFHIVLDREVPAKIREEFPPALQAFLERSQVSFEELRFHALHPGGEKILRAIEEELGLGTGGAKFSRGVLGDIGNLSSATVLFVLRRILQQAPPEPGDMGLLAAFGPGFMAEMQLWRME